MKFGDKKPVKAPNKAALTKAASGDKKAYADLVMDAFESINEDEEESRLIELKVKQREARERAMKRF